MEEFIKKKTKTKAVIIIQESLFLFENKGRSQNMSAELYGSHGEI